MGLFKSIRALAGMKKQMKAVQGQAMEQTGFPTDVGGQIAMAGGLLDQVGGILAGLGEAEADRTRLMSAGVDGRATIVSMGVPARAARLYNLTIDLEVTVPGRDPYRVANQYMVPGWARPAVGATLPVKVDPGDPAKIAIDWDAMPKPPEPGVIRPVEPGP